jgi:superfamily II DNA/RNA helicase
MIFHFSSNLFFLNSFQDVDAIHEYLLLKGILAVSTHGGKDQEERAKAVTEFRSGTKDVLVKYSLKVNEKFNKFFVL